MFKEKEIRQTQNWAMENGNREGELKKKKKNWNKIEMIRNFDKVN